MSKKTAVKSPPADIREMMDAVRHHAAIGAMPDESESMPWTAETQAQFCFGARLAVHRIRLDLWRISDDGTTVDKILWD